MALPAYKSPRFLYNGHLQTIWPTLFRVIKPPRYRRERLTTEDDDFLDLDWLQSGYKRLAVVSHGLEGDSTRHYVIGMARAMAAHGWDVLAWNFRGCGGEINRQPKFTHNGATGDLDAVLRHALENHDYESMVLIGFSMGGNLSLLYLGRVADKLPQKIRAAVCYSVPCDLESASERLAEPSNAIYMKRFMKLMGRKVARQAVNYPELFPHDNYHQLKTFHDFDGRYTAPLHGFRNARHYWAESSCKAYLHAIHVPVWIVNARNDPFLPSACYPDTMDHGNPLVTLVAPEQGGHCGFPVFSRSGLYWSESFAVGLLRSC